MFPATRPGHGRSALGPALALRGLLLLIGLLSLGWNLFAMLLYPFIGEQRGRVFGRAGIAHGYRLFWRIGEAWGLLQIDAQCLDALRNERGLILVANHPSLMDALLIVARLPRSACIMKAELMNNVFLGAGARLARYIRNDSARSLVRLAAQDLRKGGQLVIFPEGTRTVVAPLDRFRPGFTLIAKVAQVPIQSVFIDTDSPYLGKGWPLWRLPPLPVRFSLRLGQRFAPEADSAALLVRIENHFRREMGALPLGPDDTACTSKKHR